MWRLRVTYTRPSELRADVAQQLSHGGLLVRVSPREGMDLGAPVTLEFVVPGAERIVSEGTVLHVLPGHGVAVQVSAPAIARLREIAAVHLPDASGAPHARHEVVSVIEPQRTATPAPGVVPPTSAQQPTHTGTDGAQHPRAPAHPTAASTGVAPSVAGRAPPAPPGPAAVTPPQTYNPLAGQGAAGRRPLDSRALDEMSTAEKTLLALHGSREERAAILRDRNPALHPHVLRNPQITLEEVGVIAKNPQISAEVLKQIAQRKEWLGRPEIALAIARNPRAAPEVGLRALEHVSGESLRQMAKGNGVLPHIASAARKKVLSG